MGSESRRESASVVDRLKEESYRFEFFQAVRLLEQIARHPEPSAHEPKAQPVGWDGPPEQEVVRFRAHPSLRFPAGSISQFGAAKQSTHKADGAAPPEMTVSFLGLTGPSGVLPRHYTTMLIRRITLKDFGLRDYFDLFHHRLISLFYRAWAKYRFPINYEQKDEDKTSQSKDLFSHCLFSLIGMGTDHLLGRMQASDETLLYFAGHYAHQPRNAVALEDLLADYLELPVVVTQLQGQWLYLSPEDCSRMPSSDYPEGQNNVLGLNLVAGDRVWDVQSKFRIRVGPLSYGDFCRLMPTGTALRQVFELTRLYVGPEFDFDLQPVLRREEVPDFRLALDEVSGARLGWNTWVRQFDLGRDPEDALFSLDDA